MQISNRIRHYENMTQYLATTTQYLAGKTQYLVGKTQLKIIYTGSIIPPFKQKTLLSFLKHRSLQLMYTGATYQGPQCDVQTPDSVAVDLKQRDIKAVLLTSSIKRHSRSTSLGIGKYFYIYIYKYFYIYTSPNTNLRQFKSDFFREFT